MAEKFDAIIVGAGVAGLSAAYKMAKEGLKVLIIERGQYPGSKNVMGGILYRHQTDEIISEFWKEAPLERPIVEQNFWLMGSDSAVKTGYRDVEWSKPPYNNFSVFRGKFDQWFAKKCVEVGALLINETLVTECITRDNQVIGVKTDRPDGEIYANVVVISEGVNSILPRQLGFHKEWKTGEVALAVAELIKLPAEKIEDRFSLEKGMGATIEMFGDTTQGMVGTSFIYTNKETISIGCGALLSQIRQKGIKPYELLEYVKQHPIITPIIAGGEPTEYYAHLIPEGGYNSIPKLVGNGVVVVGDAAQFVNGIHREGSNMAMTSGRLAAEAIIHAKSIDDYTTRTLSHYQDMLQDSYVVKDLAKYKDASHLMEGNPAYFNKYMPIANMAMKEMFTVDGIPKSKKQKLILKRILKGHAPLKMAWDMLKLGRAMI